MDQTKTNTQKVNKQERAHDSKRVLTALSGKQKEPNRGQGSERRPSSPRAHVTGPSRVAEAVRRIFEAKNSHTHTAHCQVCGRQHALHNTKQTLAKHGYTVEGEHHGFRWFEGSCHGSDKKCLEHDHSVTDQVVHSMHHEHKSHMKTAADLEAHKVHPKHAKSGKSTRTQHPTLKYWHDEPEMVDFHHAPKEHQDHARSLAVHHHRSIAKQALEHARMLEHLKKTVHGQPPTSVQHQEVERQKVASARKSNAATKDHLRHLSHQYDKHINALQSHYLKIPHEHRTKEQMNVYYAPQFHHWSAKHSAAAHKEFPAAKETIDHIDALAAQRKAMTKKEEVAMNDFEFKQLEEGIKSQMSPHDAHEFLTKHNAHGDFHALPSETAMHIRDKSYEVGFKHNGKTANGSRARYFHAALVRHANRRTVKEETVAEAAQMKIKPEHYEALKSAVHRVLDDHPHAAAEYDKKGLSPTRFRWDALHSSRVMHTQHSDGHSLGHHIYKYANDSHIDTALKHIVASHKPKVHEGRSNEYTANYHLSSTSKSSRKPGHYLMKHGAPMHSEPHKDSSAALSAYKSLGDAKGVSIHHVKEDLEEVPGAVKTLGELKKETLKRYISVASYQTHLPKRQKGIIAATGREHAPFYGQTTSLDWRKGKIKEDAPAMSAGAAGDPGHVQNATDNHASQMSRRKNNIKALLRRKKPSLDEAEVSNLAGHVPPEFNNVELGVISRKTLEKNRAIEKNKLPKKVGPGGVDESADQYTYHHSRASWKRVATQHGYAISPEHNGKGMIANHPKHGYHVGTYNYKGQNGWISKPHPDWSK
jgi:hypothetical protein